MKIFHIDNKEQYNVFVGKQEFSSFLQSYEWGEFQKELGNKVWPLMVFKDDEPVGASLLYQKKTPMGGKYYWYCPRGPVVKEGYNISSIISSLLGELQNKERAEGVIFSRWDPPVFFDFSAFKTKKTINIQPSRTIVLDLSLSEEELLRNMHQKTRYNIRLASRKGVKVREAGKEEFNRFWELMESTSRRDGFRLHEKEHYRKMLEVTPDVFRLFVAEYQGRIVAANMVSFFGDTVTYVHGASDHEYRQVMASYALQWEVMSQVKSKGYHYYDLYGVDEEKWPGVTRFKKGFGGKEVEFPGTYDIVFSGFWYKFYKGARWLRRKWK